MPDARRRKKETLMIESPRTRPLPRSLLTAAIVIAALGATGCASAHRPAAVPFEGEAIPASADWEATFANPVDLEVHPLLTGWIKVDRSLLLHIEDPAIEDSEDRKMWVPVMAYLVRHPEKGDVLIDSGMDASFAQRRGGNFGRLARLVEVFRQEEGQDTVSLLGELGVDAVELKMVLLSHMHLDHTSGLPDIPKSVPLAAGPGAMDGYEIMAIAPADHLKGFERIQAFDFSGIEESGPGRTIDLFGDGSIFVISTPGHVPGNLSFLLNRREGPLLLTCDASHLREGFKAGVGPGLVSDREAADATVGRLGAFLKAHPSATYKAGHDVLDWDAEAWIQKLD